MGWGVDGQVVFSYSQQNKRNLSPQIFLCGGKGVQLGVCRCANSTRHEEQDWEPEESCCLGTQVHGSSMERASLVLDGVASTAQERLVRKLRSNAVAPGTCQFM